MFIAEIIIKIINIFLSVISILFLPRIVYTIAGLFLTRKFPSAKKQHKYAVLVAARNEEKVIGHLIDSKWERYRSSCDVYILIFEEDKMPYVGSRRTLPYCSQPSWGNTSARQCRPS